MVKFEQYAHVIFSKLLVIQPRSNKITSLRCSTQKLEELPQKKVIACINGNIYMHALRKLSNEIHVCFFLAVNVGV